MADLTPDQLGALTDLSGNDLLLVWSTLDSVLRKMEADVLIDLLISAAAGSYLAKANNLSDLTSASVARGNLGLGTAAVQPVGAFLQAANNLSDVPSAAAARTNLGLGALAVLNSVGAAQIDNGSVGSVELAAGAAVGNIGYTPVNKAGDAMSGPLQALRFELAGGRFQIVSDGSTFAQITWDSVLGYYTRHDWVTGKLTHYAGNIAVFSLDASGGAVFKGNVTAFGTP